MIRRVGARRLPPRTTVLFLIAILLPCAVLVGLTVLMMTQQREVSEKRRADARRALTAEIRSELLGELERLKLEAVASGRSGAALRSASDTVVLVAPVENGRLQLPWDEPAAPPAHVSNAAFAAAMRSGEIAEHQPGRAEDALRAFRTALVRAASRAEAAPAQLALARALSAAGRASDAAAADRQLLEDPPDVRDEYGIPFALYGAQRRLSAAADGLSDHPAILRVLAACLNAEPPLPTVALHMVRDRAQDVVARTRSEQMRHAGQSLLDTVTTQTRDRDQSLQLRDSLPMLLPDSSREHPWAVFGPESNRWLLSSAGAQTGKVSTIVVVRLPAFRARVESLPLLRANGVRLAEAAADNVEPLGRRIPALGVVFATPEPAIQTGEETLQRWFYIAALILVVGIAWSGGYFFWQNVQRDLRIAEMRSQFVSSVSHELKTPLTSIRMFAETLLLGRMPRPERRAEYLETIVNESERLTRLINNVLDFSKIEQGTKTYRLQSQPLADIIQSTARVMEYPLLQEGFELRLDLDPSVPPLDVDRDAMQQAILNLLSNAMKYSGASRSIELTLRKTEAEVRISVTDRGIGIAPADHARIFQKFYRSATPEIHRIPGTGLGLTVVEHVAAAHGGRVTVSSTPGEGSTFSIVLPIRSSSSITSPQRTLDSAHASHPGH